GVSTMKQIPSTCSVFFRLCMVLPVMTADKPRVLVVGPSQVLGVGRRIGEQQFIEREPVPNRKGPTNGKDRRPRRPLVVGHRGLLKHAPENTLCNMRACLELRIGIELDVRRSKDGQLIVLHDDTLDRTTNGKGKACDFTLVELKKLDA